MSKEYNVKVTNDTLKKTVESIIVHPNKDAIVRLFIGMLSTSHRGVDHFVKFSLGESFPDIPEINSVGLVKIDHLCWSGDEREVLKTSEFNQNGFIEVTVQEFIGLHDYSQLRVSFPYIENSKIIRKSTTIELTQFTLDKFDIDA